MNFKSKLILALLVSVPSTLAAVNGACTNNNGICIASATCSKYNGKSITGKCPNDPADIKCCDDIPCQSGGKTGSCMFKSQCSGTAIAGLCPGGDDFQCC
ncbi:hypothetical protein PIROE2DRAFT_43541, partial [Piromyces sp. E2]